MNSGNSHNENEGQSNYSDIEVSEIKDSAVSIGGDAKVEKHHHYYQPYDSDEKTQTEKPLLALRLFDTGRDQSLQEEISYRKHPRVYSFGIALINLTEKSVVKGIHIDLEFSWRGNEDINQPSIQARFKDRGWEMQVDQLHHNQEAILTFRDNEYICMQGHQNRWRSVMLCPDAKAKGYFLIIYKVSSIDPAAENNGHLKINILD